MVLISSISKFTLFLLSLGACSGPQLTSEKEELPAPVVSEKVKKLPAFGPQSPPDSGGMQDRTKAYGLEGERGTHFYAVDLTRNSYTDLVVLPDHHSVPVFYFYNPEKKKFIKQEPGILPTGLRASFLAFNDFNRDGIVDMMTATLNQKTALNPRPLEIYRGEWKDGRVVFQQRVKQFEYSEDPISTLVFLDFNLDGELDFFQGNWFKTRALESPRPQHDRFYLGGDRFEFQEKSEILKAETQYDDDYKFFPNAKPTFSATLCDVDLNGYPDVLTSSSEGEADKMWLNLWNDNFNRRILEDYAEEAGYDQDQIGALVSRGGGHGLFSSCADYNNNGLIDIFKSELTHSYEAQERDRSSILTGKRFEFPPQFIRTPYEFERLESRWTHAAKRGRFVDLNFDGLLDLLVDNSGFPPYTRLMLFQQNSDHSFQDQAKALGLDLMNPSGSIIVDLNKDGRADIITGQVSIREERIKSRIYVFENQIPYEGRRILRVFPKGTRSHPEALGARLILTTDERQQQRFVKTTLGGTPSQHEAGVFFGLKKGEKVESLRVVWPYEESKQKPLEVEYDLSGLKFNQFLEVSVCEDGRRLKGREASCLPH